MSEPSIFDAVIVGGGPGGLACATTLSENGKKVLLIDKKKLLGPKVCAGGVTWSGFSKHIPADLIERNFDTQYIFSNKQKTIQRFPTPVVSTVDRKKLGQWMLQNALDAGVTVKTSTSARSFKDHEIVTTAGVFKYKYLIGADGSSSFVRKNLGIPTENIGVGIHHQVPGHYPQMEWHLSSKLFFSGYAWIFPHRDSASIGAYGSRNCINPKLLAARFYLWAKKRGIDLGDTKPRASLINFDYRGIRFGNVFLVGDAAGLASGLTGEGIYPAILSGKTAAQTILEPQFKDHRFEKLIKKHRLHSRLLHFSSKNRQISFIIMEFLILCLRMGLINFTTLEMGGE